MLDWLKAAWANSKVKVGIVGGALVVATAYGTCTVEPEVVSETEVTPVEETVETVPVNDVETTEPVEVTTETTTETTATE